MCLCVPVCLCLYVRSGLRLHLPGNSQSLQSVEAYLPSPHSLPVTDALRGWCIGGSWCPGLGAQVCTSSLPVATWRGLVPVARSGLFRGKGGPRASGLGACNSVHSGTAGCRQSRRARRCSPLWLLLRGYWVTPSSGDLLSPSQEGGTDAPPVVLPGLSHSGASGCLEPGSPPCLLHALGDGAMALHTL